MWSFRTKLIDLWPASDNAQFMQLMIVNRFPTPDVCDCWFYWTVVVI